MAHDSHLLCYCLDCLFCGTIALRLPDARDFEDRRLIPASLDLRLALDQGRLVVAIPHNALATEALNVPNIRLHSWMVHNYAREDK